MLYCKLSSKSREFLCVCHCCVAVQGANQAAAAGKLGYPTIFLGQVVQPTPHPIVHKVSTSHKVCCIK